MRQVLKNKLDNLFRLVLLKSVANRNKSILLTEYPKSGGSWLGEMLSELTGIDFPRNKFPSLRRSIFHGHYLPKYGLQNVNKIICLIRDGRDVAVSYYFHQLFLNDKTSLNKKEIKYYTDLYGFDNVNDVEANLPKFISSLNNHIPSKFFHFLYPGTWNNFYQKWLDYSKAADNIIFVKYEDLRVDPVTVLKELLKFLGEDAISEKKIEEVVARNSFSELSKRKAGSEDRNSFMRKGIVGDWKNYFSEQAVTEFKRYGQGTLELFDYEKNEYWGN